MMYADNLCTYTEDSIYYIFTGSCIQTKKKYSVRVPKAELYAYRQGIQHIQDAMPSVSPGDREFLMTGISPEGFKQIFSGGEY